MARVATVIPAENDLLCEGCGYTLNGLPLNSRCPECGRAIADSVGSQRRLPAWETAESSRTVAFLRVTAATLFHPTHFYRTLATRREARLASRFARWHWILASLLFALCAAGHADWYNRTFFSWYRNPWILPALAAGFAPLIYVFLAVTTRVAARLTNWEASYRGYRLPLSVVSRGMSYHATHYLPVALGAAVTVWGYRFLLVRHVIGIETATKYLYVLSAEVVLAAGYLFQTYWIGMRNMMYANR